MGKSDFAPRAPGHEVLLNFNWNVLTLKQSRRGGVGFPAGSVVKNLPANEGDTGSVPDLGRLHVPWHNLTRAATTESMRPGSRALQRKGSPQ